MKTILILAFSLITLSAVSQTNKAKKDSTDNYIPCTECFESWKTKTMSQNQNNFETPNLNVNPTAKKIFGEVSRPVKIVLATVGSIFMAALITKTTNMTNAITVQ